MTGMAWSFVLLAGILSLFSPLAWRPALASAGVFDVPNQRSSHSKPTLRGGGLAPLTAILVAGVLLIFNVSGQSQLGVAVTLAAAILVSLLGLIEDIVGLPIVIRAGGQLLVGGLLAMALSWITEINWLWIPCAALFFAANVNFTNFMDGVNGISALHGLVVGLAYSWIGFRADYMWVMVLGLITAAAFISFLPWNIFPPGMFLGDTGSYLLGGMTAALAIALIFLGIEPWIALAPLSIYWLDTVATLVRRSVGGKPIFEAHRTHIYQQLTDRKISHLGVAFIVAGFSGAVSVVSIAMMPENGMEYLILISIVLIIWGVYLGLPNLVKKRKFVLQ